jgi:hypothetical protein
MEPPGGVARRLQRPRRQFGRQRGPPPRHCGWSIDYGGSGQCGWMHVAQV